MMSLVKAKRERETALNDVKCVGLPGWHGTQLLRQQQMGKECKVCLGIRQTQYRPRPNPSNQKPFRPGFSKYSRCIPCSADDLNPSGCVGGGQTMPLPSMCFAAS